jgi:hypothetical protein
VLDRRLVETGNAEVFEGDPLAIEHPEDVMVRDDKERGRVGERFVAREPGGIGMTVRTHDRKRADLAIEASSDCPHRRVGRK